MDRQHISSKNKWIVLVGERLSPGIDTDTSKHCTHLPVALQGTATVLEVEDSPGRSLLALAARLGL